MRRSLARALRTLLCLAAAHPLAAGALAAQAAPPADIQRGDWELALQLGLTSFGVDRSAPGTMTVVGLGRHLTNRFSLALEGGFGSIESTGYCQLGQLGTYECAQSSTWPTVGLGSRFVFLEDEGSATRTYSVVQFVAHGPDMVASYDLGVGVSWRTLAGVDVGIELRHRFGYDGASGGMYFFRISR